MSQNPVFVKIDEYNEAVALINTIKAKVKEANNTLEKFNDLRNKEEAELDQWKNHLDEVDKKVDFIDRTLFEPQGE